MAIFASIWEMRFCSAAITPLICLSLVATCRRRPSKECFMIVHLRLFLANGTLTGPRSAVPTLIDPKDQSPRAGGGLAVTRRDKLGKPFRVCAQKVLAIDSLHSDIKP